MVNKNPKFCYLKTLPLQSSLSAISTKGKHWTIGDTIDIAFIGGTTKQRLFVRKYANEWLEYANLRFNWDVPLNKSDVRISFKEGMGSWSYVGTDALFVNQNQPTMNFGWLDVSVVLHEFGHMLGLKHEHQHPESGIEWDTKQVYRDLSGPPNNWGKNQIYTNVLEKLSIQNITFTSFDMDSIMLYFFPKSWTKNGISFKRNTKLSKLDKQHIAEIYPKSKQFKNEKTGFRRFLERIEAFFSS